jgi:septal ring factor EnvC (AmiA/AmiB activator)
MKFDSTKIKPIYVDISKVILLIVIFISLNISFGKWIFDFPDLYILPFGFILALFLGKEKKLFFLIFFTIFLLSYFSIRTSFSSVLYHEVSTILILSLSSLITSFVLSFFTVKFLYDKEENFYKTVKSEDKKLEKEKEGEEYLRDVNYQRRTIEELKEEIRFFETDIENEIRKKFPEINSAEEELEKRLEREKKRREESIGSLHELKEKIFHFRKRVSKIYSELSSFIKDVKDTYTYTVSFIRKIENLKEVLASEIPAKTAISIMSDKKILELKDIFESFSNSFKEKVEKILKLNSQDIEEKIFTLRILIYSLKEILKKLDRINYFSYAVSLKISQVASGSGDSAIRRTLLSIAQDIDNLSFKSLIIFNEAEENIKKLEKKTNAVVENLDEKSENLNQMRASIKNAMNRLNVILENRIQNFTQEVSGFLNISEIEEINKFISKNQEYIQNVLEFGQDIEKKLLVFIDMLERIKSDIDELINIFILYENQFEEIISREKEILEELSGIEFGWKKLYLSDFKSISELRNIKNIISEFEKEFMS